MEITQLLRRRERKEGHQVGTNPLLNVKKRKVSFNFQKKILLEYFHSNCFYLPNFHYHIWLSKCSPLPPPSLTTVRFLREACPWTLLDCLCLWCSKTPRPSVDPLSKNPGDAYGRIKERCCQSLNVLIENVLEV